tara:strand:- start:833 stop:2554 length:1722 start_codon:yes stop_codon:yes gene_type:complete
MKIKSYPVSPASALTLEMHPVLKQILGNRGVTDNSECTLDLDGLASPGLILNINHAVSLLRAALEQQDKILVVGDFDADGATSTALLLLCLRRFGFEQVDYLVPNRFEFGYGLTPEIVEVAKQRQPALIITVDNGIASIDGVARATELGIKVLITDHHLPGTDLPAAECIINPNQFGCTFPSKALAGVGVVYYLMLALRADLRDTGWFNINNRSEPNMLQYLDLVALGTVADVVPLDKNNRCLVKHGVQLIRSGRCRPGINALLEIAGQNKHNLNASDLGFVLGPRLNAAGRLDDMSLGIECLLTENPHTAYLFAQQLNDLNKDRKNIEQSMQDQAMAFLSGLEDDAEKDTGLCLFNADWHQGVVGILASRLKDKFHRPAIVFACSTENSNEIKGSARSIPGIHIRDLLDIIATKHPGLLSKFGGHAMAAGLSIYAKDFVAFKTAFNQELENLLDPHMLEQVIYTDGSLPADCLTLQFAELLEQAGPWGQQFPEPLFIGDFEVLDQRVLGARHLKLLLQAPASEQAIDAIAFNVSAEILGSKLSNLELLYRLQVNEFRGVRSVQLMIEEFIEA